MAICKYDVSVIGYMPQHGKHNTKWAATCGVVLRASTQACTVSSSLGHALDLASFTVCVFSGSSSEVFLVYSGFLPSDHLFGLVVKASTSRADDPGFESRWRRDISRLSHTCDLNIGTPVATMTCVWLYRVSAGTGWPGVSIL